MKKLLAYILLLPFVFAATGQETTFIIEGTMETEPESIVLERWNIDDTAKKIITETSAIDGGRFIVEADLEPGLYLLRAEGLPVIYLVLDRTGTTLNVHVHKKGDGFATKVTGSADTELLMKYESFRKQSLAKWMNKVRAELRKAEQNGDHEAVKKLQAEENKNYQAHRNELTNWVAKNMGTSLAVYATSKRWTLQDLDYMKKLEPAFVKAHPGLHVTKMLVAKIERFKQIAPGNLAPSIAGPAPDGTTKKLADYRGNYVLIDFWASWCGPCIRELSTLKNLYNRFGHEGFVIFGVSLDKNRKRWLSAIESHGINWVNISELKGYFDRAAFTYNVTSIPSNFLIDPEGKIIDYNLFGDELEEKLIEIFGK